MPWSWVQDSRDQWKILDTPLTSCELKEDKKYFLWTLILLPMKQGMANVLCEDGPLFVWLEGQIRCIIPRDTAQWRENTTDVFS